MSLFGFIGTSGAVVPLDPRDELGEPVDHDTARRIALQFATTSELPVVMLTESGDWQELAAA